MRSKRILAIALAAVVVMAVPAIAIARPIFIGGSTSVEPLAKKLAVAYHSTFPKRPVIKVSGGQSDVGISGVAAGRFDIGDSSRNPEVATDPHHLVWTKIAKDAVCLITNPANPLSNLTKEQVEAIFTGKDRTWGAVSPQLLSNPRWRSKSISVFDRDSASGTQDAFKHIFLPLGSGEGTQQVTPIASAQASNGTERAAVAGTEGGIGFVSIAFTAGVHKLSYQGIPCTLPAARSGEYKGVRAFWMVTHHAPKGRCSSSCAGSNRARRLVRSSTATGSRSTRGQWLHVRSTQAPSGAHGDRKGAPSERSVRFPRSSSSRSRRWRPRSSSKLGRRSPTTVWAGSAPAPNRPRSCERCMKARRCPGTACSISRLGS